ncbi:MAG: L,D-transpeptidase [Actinomycetota bacterium]
MVRFVLCATLAVLLAVGGQAVPAWATHAEVTLEASATVVKFGQSVVLLGTLKPAPEGGPAVEGQPIRIVDGEGTEVTTATTDGAGEYSASLVPRANVTLYAEWTDDSLPETVQSEPVTVSVRPLLSISLRRVFLFARAKVSGRLRPAQPGERVVVELFRGWTRVARREVRLVDGATYRTTFAIRRPGRYWARARFSDDDHLPKKVRTERRVTPLPYLQSGSRHVTVRYLEGRLQELHYKLPGLDERFDIRTADAVLAFNKVQGRSRVQYVNESTWRALVNPRRPRAVSRTTGFHIEVDKTKQVLYTVRDGRITNILHVSTGQYEGWTRDGVFRVHGKVYGYSVGRLYYPSYFDGLRAVHGWPEVPPYPASHGCVRVPMWSAVWISGRMPVGTEVRIYRT